MPFLPSNVGHGTITGRLMDTNGNPVTGAVTFTPTPRKILNTGANVTILPAPVSFPLAELVVDDVDPISGAPRQYTVGAIPEGSQLVATNDADNNPFNWTYTVTFSLAGGLTTEPFSIDVPEGTIVDLTAASPVPASNGTVIVRGPGVPDGGFAGQVLVKSSDANQDTKWGDMVGGGEGGVAGVTSVNGRAGSVVLTKDDVDLENVDNTSDMDKPISAATQEALDGKQPAGSYAAGNHSHAAASIADVTATGLAVMTATGGAAARTAIGAGTSNLELGATATTAKPGDWVPTVADVTGLGDELDTKADQTQVDSMVSTAVATRMPILAGAPVGRFRGFLTANPDLATLAEGDWWFIIEADA